MSEIHIEFENPELMYLIEGLPKEMQEGMVRVYQKAVALREALKQEEREKRNARDRARYRRKQNEPT